MKKIIKSQELFQKLVDSEPMVENICYDENSMVYTPIDWTKEYLVISKIKNRITIERIDYARDN